MAMFLAAKRVYSGYKSFALSSNDTIAKTAQWQLFFTMYAILAIRDNLYATGSFISLFSLFSLFWLPRFCEDVHWGGEDRRGAYLTKIRTLERV